ncbi:hypothetical protein [Frankia gtarii]|uniref:hypothetical protein n=1 Tax=Frankia gtarii TaxID=2950102 RepID=UPI0021BF4B52|nr:hypothetical protein [Frankia gtarii]
MLLAEFARPVHRRRVQAAFEEESERATVRLAEGCPAQPIRIRLSANGFTSASRSRSNPVGIAGPEARTAAGTFRHARPASDAVIIQDIVTNVLLRRRDEIEQNDGETVMATIYEFPSRAIGVRH